MTSSTASLWRCCQCAPLSTRYAGGRQGGVWGGVGGWGGRTSSGSGGGWAAAAAPRVPPAQRLNPAVTRTHTHILFHRRRQAVLDALRARRERFVFEGAEIRLRPSAMAFITMNPGYPGRAELPESLKVGGGGVWGGWTGGSMLPAHEAAATCTRGPSRHPTLSPSHPRAPALQALFRPVSMAVPDLALICEIMLMAEGFQQSRLLSRKFIILYRLCEDLLSKVGGAPTCSCTCTRAASPPAAATRPHTRQPRARASTDPPAPPPAAPPGPPLRLEAARHQDHALRGGQHEARGARAFRWARARAWGWVRVRACGALRASRSIACWSDALTCLPACLPAWGRVEDRVLLRALRDFNLGKLTADDTSIFVGLLGDLFPRISSLVPRSIDTSFEVKVRAQQQ